jgi:hypothetical protein
MKYIFVRQVKSGSTSLTTYLNRAFGKNRCFQGNADPYMESLSDPFNYLNLLMDIERLRMVQGHLYLAPDWELDDRYRVISVIRHPVERLVSFFYYNRGKSARQYRPIPKDMSLLEFAQNIDGMWPHLKSDQIRRLSPTLDMEQIRRAMKSGKLIYCTTDLLDKFPAVLRDEIPLQDVEPYPTLHDALPDMMPDENRQSYPEPLAPELLELENHLTREMELFYYVRNEFIKKHLEVTVTNDIA